MAGALASAAHATSSGKSAEGVRLTRPDPGNVLLPAFDAVGYKTEGAGLPFATVCGGLPAEDYARELLEAVPAAVFATDAVGRIVFYNQAAVDLWGIRPEWGN
jgi:PAS domain-containing protein